MSGLMTMDRQSQPQAKFHDQGSTMPAPDLPHQVDPRVVLSSIGEAVYDWDIATDTLSWSGNAVSLFGVQQVDRLGKGEDFNKLLDPISPATRSEAILLCDTRDAGGGVPYRLSFAIQQSKGALLWFEDTGRWFAGADGRAAAAHGVVRRIEGPTEHERREIASSKIDELTGGYLRAPFVRLMADDLAKAKTRDKTAVVMLVAIDDLSFVNTSLGFEAADEVIAGVARRLRGAIRGRDRLARFSGTKLGVLLTTFDGEDVREAAYRLMAAVSAEPVHTSAGPVAVKLQIGSASAPQDGSDPVTLLKRAEEALTEARAAANPDFVAYRADVSRDEARRRNLSASDDVLRALNDRRVIIALEPVLSADGRVLQFHEALVRVRAEDGAILGAGAIIPVAERFGLVKFVDIRVLELAIDMLRGDPRSRLSVNVSMRTAVTPEWMTAISSLVAANPGVANRLIVEITETAAMSDLDTTAEIVRRIKDLGLRVAIDDFGSGHTSFRSLRALPVDILKIDGVFVQNLARSADDRFFVRTLVDLAGHLGVQTVAEWVQDEETANLLAEWGVTFLQGEFCGLARIEGEAESAHEPLRAVG
jgi:diguanylate cyclase (GGDEF)-like protein